MLQDHLNSERIWISALKFLLYNIDIYSTKTELVSYQNNFWFCSLWIRSSLVFTSQAKSQIISVYCNFLEVINKSPGQPTGGFPPIIEVEIFYQTPTFHRDKSFSLIQRLLYFQMCYYCMTKKRTPVSVDVGVVVSTLTGPSITPDRDEVMLPPHWHLYELLQMSLPDNSPELEILRPLARSSHV